MRLRNLSMNNTCPIHNKAIIDGKYGPYCPTKLKNGRWCKGREPNEFDDSLETPEVPTKPDTDAEVWKAKDRLSAAQTALKAASEVTAALISSGVGLELVDEDVKKKANEYFKWLMDKKYDN